jgi:hypothetical protein
MATIRSSDLNRFRSGGREQSSSPRAEPFSPIASGKTEAPSSRHVLPKNLDAAIRQLDDQELDRLVAAALEERTRRKPFVPEESQSKRRADAVAVSLPQGKLNAVRAAFKAGVTPARIAREFGLRNKMCKGRWPVMPRSNELNQDLGRCLWASTFSPYNSLSINRRFMILSVAD